MGAGCSSPLRRLGGKRGKPAQRDSISIEALGKDEEQLTIAATLQAQQQDQQSKQPIQKLIVENEITIQSEINDDHPSTASYYTDGKYQGNDITTTKTTCDIDVNQDSARTPSSKLISAGAAAAKAMGLSGSYIPHDRHLLVSPALSPAPSICQSPAPASTHSGTPISLDVNDLNEAFKTITFGLSDNHQSQLSNNNKQQKIKLPEKSEMHNYYTQQLVQSQNDLVNYVSVLFFNTDNPNPHDQERGQQNVGDIIEILTEQLETNLKAFCDENSFDLRFLNLSQDHLSKCLRVNNLQDAAMTIFEKEYQDNGQRLIVIVLANNNNSLNGGSSSDSAATPNENLKQQSFDNRLLPTKMDAQIMNNLKNSANLPDEVKSLLKKWYNQVGNLFYLNPIYLVNQNILSDSKEERDQAWQSWTNDSKTIIQALTMAQIASNNTDHESSISLKSLFATYMDFITKETQLHKRTLLIKNYPHSGNIMPASQLISSTATVRFGNLNELSRLLADPNKLTLKRIMSEDEFSKTITDWVCENCNKYIESFSETRINQGKYVPPFIERNLFIELTCQRHHLERYLDSISEGFESKCNLFYKSHIKPLLNSFSDSSCLQQQSLSANERDAGRQTPESQQLSANHLVVISGPERSGKTTLLSQLVKHIAQDFCTQAQIIYRFCGITVDSFSPNRLLRSVCEQFCQTQGENITAASYIYSSRREVISSLNKIVKQQNIIILLDGLNELNYLNESSLDWLCEIESNPRIKIIIMLETSSELYKKLLSSYDDATFICLDNPTTNELAQILTTRTRSSRFNSAAGLFDEIKNLDPNDSSKPSITFGVVDDIMNICHIRRLNNEHCYPELSNKIILNNSPDQPTSKLIYTTIFKHLQYLLPPYLVCSMFVVLESSRQGLSEQDFLNIMNLISKKKTSKQTSEQQQVRLFTSCLLYYLKIQLQPWLRHVLRDRTVKMVIQREFIRQALDYFIPEKFPNVRGETREMLLEYYNRTIKQPSRSFKTGSGGGGGGNSGVLIASGDGNSESRDYVNNIERIWLSTQASEIMNLLILTNPSKAKDYIMNKQQFYSQFLHRFTPEEFIEDYDRLKTIFGRKMSQNEEMQHLVNYIRQSIFSLRYDGCQIYSQIYCRAHDHYKTGKFSKSKKFNDILTIASSPPTRNLLPVSEISIDSFIRTRIGLNQPPTSSLSATSSLNVLSVSQQRTVSGQQQKSSSGPTTSYQQQQQQQQQGKQKIFTIKDNHRHVIVIYPDKGSLFVWDIYEEKPVRIINNIDQPRDLRMIDQKRAIILCNRELRVYDLDSGLMLTKLKGVMNQKMPFFEVFGEDYVVALARNRMYVNMLNLNTGELETTFKVGEDRFLNSLLVSANGGICVCGDETQKPFPLLVWNLNERRLMYDLRLDKHEFITRMSAISDDGHFVVSVCKQLGDSSDSSGGNNGSSSLTSGGALAHKSSPNFIVIYDLNSGTLFKKWKPGLDTCGVAISLFANRSGKVMNTMVDSSILVWDLATGSKRHTLVGHSAPADVIRVQNGRLFSMDSTCRDQSLRIWDIEEGYCLAVFSPDAPVSCCQMSTRGDALVCGFAAETRLSTLVVCKNETVSDVVKRNKRRKSSKSLYVFDESPSRKSSS